MKKNTSVIIFFILLSGCITNKEAIYNKQMKVAFIEEFKIKYFKKLLNEAYNGSDEIKTVLHNDQSGFSEPILSLRDINLIDSFVKIDNHILVLDSIKRIGNAPEGAKGKRALGFALLKYESKWLDSLAKAISKIFYKHLRTE
jgi:hypothetical protein